MNNIAYKNRIPSPFQVARKQPLKEVEKTDTVHEEVKKLLGTYEFTATFEEDIQTAATLKDVPGRVVAFICTLKLGNKVVGLGRGVTALNRVNKLIVRNIGFTFNSALIDAV